MPRKPVAREFHSYEFSDLVLNADSSARWSRRSSPRPAEQSEYLRWAQARSARVQRNTFQGGAMSHDRNSLNHRSIRGPHPIVIQSDAISVGRSHPIMADAPFGAASVAEQALGCEEVPAPAPHPHARVVTVDAAKNGFVRIGAIEPVLGNGADHHLVGRGGVAFGAAAGEPHRGA